MEARTKGGIWISQVVMHLTEERCIDQKRGNKRVCTDEEYVAKSRKEVENGRTVAGKCTYVGDADIARAEKAVGRLRLN